MEPLPAFSDDPFTNDMVPGAQSALTNVLDMNKGDRVLVVTDSSKQRIGQAFRVSACKLGGLVNFFMLEEPPRPYMKVPSTLKKTISDQDIIINAFSANSTETPFRVELTHLEAINGSKVGHAPGITEDMMLGGPMNVDYQKIATEANRLMKLLKGVNWVHITTDAGTDFKLCIKDREFETDTKILPGKIGNLPAGEIWCAPVETEGCGTVVIDGTIGDVGKVPTVLTIEIEQGKITRLKSDDHVFLDNIKELVSIDPMANVIGELGIGLNPKARLVGNMLEDEKAGGTAHIAFGDNIDMPGGKNNSCTHRDFLFHKPTITVEKNGDEFILLDSGKVTV
ncbi:MAG TPA: leucyl aminopeptidase [Euryarchaeota archaeon]|nr:leucyl aminopeptidase [Euryarchaeota archaeon]